MPKKFDRQMLAQFLPNPESIRAFEELLRATDVDLPEKVEAAAAAARDALGKYDALTGEEGAAKIGFDPVGGVSAENVQGAIAELDVEKASGAQVQAGAFNVAVSSGTGDALIGVFTPTITTRVPGALLLVRSITTNATATPTLKVNGLDPVGIVKAGGVAMSPGEIVANNWLLFSYDAVLSKYILHNPTTQVSTQVMATSLNGGPLAGRRNRIMNGNFAINQRNVSGTVTLAAGAHGHDRWKAGSGGCTYTFSTVGADTTITITAGTLVHVVDSDDIEGGAFMLSQAGTAQVRYAIGGAALSGAYFATPVAVPTSGGQVVKIEFTTGTVALVQLERGTLVSPFERSGRGQELDACQYYYWRGVPCRSLNTNSFADGVLVSWIINFPKTMRIIPTLSKNTTGSSYSGLASEMFNEATRDGARLLYTCVGVNANANVTFSAGSWFEASADM